MDFLKKIINYFGTDGLLHIIASTVIVAVCNLFMPLWCAVAVAAVSGLGKELVYDKWMGKGTFDWKDLLCDAIGIIIGCL